MIINIRSTRCYLWVKIYVPLGIYLWVKLYVPILIFYMQKETFICSQTTYNFTTYWNILFDLKCYVSATSFWLFGIDQNIKYQSEITKLLVFNNLYEMLAIIFI